ncbi:MAG: SPOR domain-containing protein [Treponema sp.]|jgi:hypothetical protein|nr:SPOR domain-containing protein [Treponema sp.]
MKKFLVVFIITALCLFLSASPWEGAAATAPEGELPGNGRYIATNSFPKNTIVDIVNIETNKSTRVIVANNLDSPGLLAIVSREAAELIGMRPGSVSRIRMTQPSDPVAYVRFTESLASGIADYDSGNIITEESYNEEAFKPADPPQRVSSAPPPAASTNTGSAYVLEPEWRGAGSARDIVDLPLYAAPEKIDEEIAVAEPEVIDETELPEEIAEAEPEAVSEIAEYIPEDDPAEIAEYFPENEYYEYDYFEEPEEVAKAPEVIDDYFEDDYFDEPEEVVEYFPEEKIEYNLIPTDERPPMNIYGIDPAFIIPGITRAEEPEAASDPRIEPVFSIPRIYELTRGSYYVQLAAHDTAESVENSIRRIDQNYKPVVYKDGDRWYRVLLGPLNQGESYAVLQRFKSIGYNDAFVRLAR